MKKGPAHESEDCAGLLAAAGAEPELNPRAPGVEPMPPWSLEISKLALTGMQAAANGVLIADREAKIVWANPAMEKLTGYSLDELLGQTPHLFYSGVQPGSFYREMWGTILRGEKWHGELVNRRKDGSFYDEDLTITPIRNPTGEITHFIGVKQDITQRKRAEERASLLAQVIENTAELIGVSDREGRITYVNPALCRTLGYSSEEMRGSHFTQFLSPENSPKVMEEIREKALSAEGWRGECLVARQDLSTIPVYFSTGQMKDERGRLLGSYGILQDMTERKKAEESLRRSEELFRQVAENISEVFFASTPEPTRIMYVSPAYERIWGRPRDLLYSKPDAWVEAIVPEDRERAAEIFRTSQRGLPTDMDYRITRPDGSLRWIRNRTFPVHDTTGGFVRVVGFAEDITDRREAEEQLRKAHESLRVTLADAEQRNVETERLTEMLEMIQCCRTVEQAYEIASNQLGALFAPASGALCITSSSRTLVEEVASWGAEPATERAFAPDDCWALRRGKLHKVADASSPVRCQHIARGLGDGTICVPLVAQGETLGLLYLENCEKPVSPPGRDPLEDLSRRAKTVAERLSLALANLQLREVLRLQSVRDPLTGLFNRRYMEETLTRELARAARRKESVAVAFCDLDHFKQFNDTFGHEAGDLALREFGKLIKSHVRVGDLACRYGGEEFVLILPDASAEVARGRAQAIVNEAQSLGFSQSGRTLGGITVSIGVAVYPDQGSTSEELLHAADQALYRAKQEGRNRAVVFGASR